MSGGASRAALLMADIAGDAIYAAIMALGPIAYYLGNEPLGSPDAIDAVGGTSGTYENGPTLGKPGPLAGGGTAVDYDGVDDHADIPRTDLDGLPACTSISFLKTTHAGRGRIWGAWDDAAATTRAHLLTISNGSDLAFVVSDGLGTASSVVPGAAVRDGIWHMVGGDWAGEEIDPLDRIVRAFYDDAAPVSSTAIASMGGGTVKAMIGAAYKAAAPGYSFPIGATICHCAVFDYVLSDAQRLSIHTASGL